MGEPSSDDSNKLDIYDPSLDMPIALRKGTRFCMKHSVCNYISYSNLLTKFRVFTTSLDIAKYPRTYMKLWKIMCKTGIMKGMGAP